jgi:hypothetical protein
VESASSDIMFFAVNLLLHDLRFVQAHGGRFPRTLFPKGPLQALAALALEQAQRYRRTVSPTVLAVCLQGGWGPPDFYGTTDEEMRAIYHDLDQFAVDDDARPRVVELVLAWSRQRQMGMALDESAQALAKGDEEAAAAALSSARRPFASEEEPLRLDRDFRRALTPLPENAIPTGFTKVDSAWVGGIRPRELGVVLAATNVGKTSALCFFAATAYKKNYRVLYYTFELAPRQVLRRIVSAVLRRPAGNVPVEEGPELLEQIRRNRHLNGADIEIRGGTKSVGDLMLDLEELDQEGRKPHIILLDSGDDLIPRLTYQTLYMTQGELYADLRKLAMAVEVAIWSSTQATREAIDKARISLKHMGDSFWKARRGHYVLGFAQTEQERNEPFGPYMSLHIIKDSEHGSAGRSFQLRPQFGRGGDGWPGFEEVDRPDD